MLNKLAFRNARRSSRDYIVYVLTMTVMAAMMFAFDSMALSPDILSMFREAGVMGAMIGLVQRVYRGNPCMADPLYDAVYAGKKKP